MREEGKLEGNMTTDTEEYKDICDEVDNVSDEIGDDGNLETGAAMFEDKPGIEEEADNIVDQHGNKDGKLETPDEDDEDSEAGAALIGDTCRPGREEGADKRRDIVGQHENEDCKLETQEERSNQESTEVGEQLECQPNKVIHGDVSCLLSYDFPNIKTTRQHAVLTIDDNIAFCKIVTLVYQLNEGDVIQQHYVTDATEQVSGNIGLRDIDELLEVNGISLVNKPQSFVVATFQKLKLDRVDPGLQLTLKVHRWQRPRTHDAMYSTWNTKLTQEIQLTLVPVTKPWHKQRFPVGLHWLFDWLNQIKNKEEPVMKLKVKDLDEKTSDKKSLSRGNINVKRVHDHPPFRKQILIFDKYDRNYIHWTSDGLLYPEVLQSDDEALFLTELFTGYDTSPAPFTYRVYGFRFYCWIHGRKWYLHFDNDYNVFCKVCNDDRIASGNIDERCFIVRSDGDQCLLQSAVIRDRFLSYMDGKFSMKRVQPYKLIFVSKGIYVREFDTCKFVVRCANKSVCTTQ